MCKISWSVCKSHTSHEIKVMSFSILFHEWNISTAFIPFYSIEKTELQVSLSLYPLRIIFRKRVWLIKASLKTHFISFKTVWNTSSLKDIDPIPLNFDLSISMLFKVSMYFNDYAYVCILLPQIMILQLRKTGGIFKETEYTLTHIVYN